MSTVKLYSTVTSTTDLLWNIEEDVLSLWTVGFFSHLICAECQGGQISHCSIPFWMQYKFWQEGTDASENSMGCFTILYWQKLKRCLPWFSDQAICSWRMRHSALVQLVPIFSKETATGHLDFLVQFQQVHTVVYNWRWDHCWTVGFNLRNTNPSNSLTIVWILSIYRFLTQKWILSLCISLCCCTCAFAKLTLFLCHWTHYMSHMGSQKKKVVERDCQKNLHDPSTIMDPAHRRSSKNLVGPK